MSDLPGTCLELVVLAPHSGSRNAADLARGRAVLLPKLIKISADEYAGTSLPLKGGPDVLPSLI
jgi:hypothetical protein